MTAVPEIEHVESLVKKPDTSTVEPSDPELGLSIIDGGTVVRTRLAEAVSPTALRRRMFRLMHKR
jgi:hypothetical protein